MVSVSVSFRTLSDGDRKANQPFKVGLLRSYLVVTKRNISESEARTSYVSRFIHFMPTYDRRSRAY